MLNALDDHISGVVRRQELQRVSPGKPKHNHHPTRPRIHVTSRRGGPKSEIDRVPRCAAEELDAEILQMRTSRKRSADDALRVTAATTSMNHLRLIEALSDPQPACVSVPR